MKKLLLLISFVLIPSACFSDEIVADFTDNSVPVINEILRSQDVATKKVEDRVTVLESSSYTPTAANALSGSIVQEVYVELTTTGSTGTAFPFDTSKPQIGEGGQVTTLAITPTSASNYLEISALTHVSNSGATARLVGCLFQDSTADAISCSSGRVESSGAVIPLPIKKYMTAATSSSTTFKLRVGGESGTTYWNRSADTDGILGGTLITSINIKERKA